MTSQPIALLHEHMRRCRTASLGTLKAGDGTPYVSLVNFTIGASGHPLLLLSGLAWHSKNLLEDHRGSLLLADIPNEGDALVGQRMTLIGQFEKSDHEKNREVYLRHHPEAETYVDFGDFGFWQMMPKQVHVVAGFGQIKTYDAEDVFPLMS
jgi:heme iron utilization protein